MPQIPELEPHCGSWVASYADTGRAFVELTWRPNVEAVAAYFGNAVIIETAAQYLGRINAAIAASNA